MQVVDSQKKGITSYSNEFALDVNWEIESRFYGEGMWANGAEGNPHVGVVLLNEIDGDRSYSLTIPESSDGLYPEFVQYGVKVPAGFTKLLRVNVESQAFRIPLDIRSTDKNLISISWPAIEKRRYQFEQSEDGLNFHPLGQVLAPNGPIISLNHQIKGGKRIFRVREISF